MKKINMKIGELNTWLKSKGLKKHFKIKLMLHLLQWGMISQMNNKSCKIHLLDWMCRKAHTFQMTLLTQKIRLVSKNLMRFSLKNLILLRGKSAERICLYRVLKMANIIWNGLTIQMNGKILFQQMKLSKKVFLQYMEWILKHIKKFWMTKNIKA